MGDMVKRMVAEEYLSSNIAAGLKTPKTARKSDRSRLHRVTLAEYWAAWSVLDERERLAFDLVTFCGLRESEVYGLKIGDLFQQGAIRVERSWYKGEINPTKTNEIRKVGVGVEIFNRLEAWIGILPDCSKDGWLFPSERLVTPLLPENVLRRCIRPRLEPLGSTSPSCDGRIPHYTKRRARTPRSLLISRATASVFTYRSTLRLPWPESGRPHRRSGLISWRCRGNNRLQIETNETRADLVGYASY